MMVWDQDGLMLGWFDTPKTFSDFFQRLLNVLLTNGLGFGIMQSAFDRKMDPKLRTQDTSCSYFITVCFVRLAFRLGFPKPHLLSQGLLTTSQMFLQQMLLPSLLTLQFH